MLQLEINLCFFAFYELVPDWRRITHNGPGEEQKQSQSGKCQYPDWGITWSITKLWLWLVRPLIGYLAFHTGLSLVTVDQSLTLQTMNNPLCTLTAPRTPVFPLSINFSSFLFWLWTMFVLVATTALLFSSFRSYFSVNLSRLFSALSDSGFRVRILNICTLYVGC